MYIALSSLIITIVLSLSACGGGGGGGGSATNSTPSGGTTDSTQLVATAIVTGIATGGIPLVVAFDGSSSVITGSAASPPTITDYAWDFGDGATDSGAQVTHTYTDAGTFTVVLTISDSNARIATDQVTITAVGFNLSGTITAASGTVVDIDVNDPSRQNKAILGNAFENNDQTSEAQLLPNPVILNGFVSAVSAGAPESGVSNYEVDIDSNDFYIVELTAGQFVSLRIADFDGSDPRVNDLDLALLDTNNVLPPQISNENDAEVESVSAPADGIYYIRVQAFSGISKYVLNIGIRSFAAGAKAHGKPLDIIEGEAIVKIEATTVPSKVGAKQSNSAIALSHNDPNRAGLMRFDIPQIVMAQTANLSPKAQLSARIQQRYHAQFETAKMIKQLRARTDVEYAEPNYRVYPKLVPNDPLYSLQAHYPQINLPQAWNITTGGSGSVIVAVVDTGVVLNHEDLQAQLVDGFDFIRDPNTARDGDGIDNNPDDPGDSTDRTSSWHGTHVAGTVAARSNNNLGVAGVSWGARIMPIRTLGLGGGTTYDVEQGIRYAAGLANDSGTLPSQAADIINLSLGGGGFSQASQNLFNQIRDETNTIVIAAAGNENTVVPSYPASYTNVVSVSAVDLINVIAPYSNTGIAIDVAAPGGDMSVDRNGDGYGDGVLSTLIEEGDGGNINSYQFLQGTSMAAPHVAGIAALMKAVHPGLTAADFDLSLQQGTLTNDLGATGRDDTFGYGLIDALKAVQQAQLLAGGNATGAFLTNPNRIDFGAFPSNISNTLELTPAGSSTPTVNSYIVTGGAPWLTVDSDAANDDGSGIYTLTVDRSGLANAIYSDTLVFDMSTGSDLVIPVTMQVQENISTQGDTGFIFVLLLEADSDQLVAQIDVDVSNGQYGFTFNNISPGEYIIIAGSDIDNDSSICGIGETCGSYPTNDQPLHIAVGQNVTDLDFVVSIVSDVMASSVNAGGYEGEKRSVVRLHNATTDIPVPATANKQFRP